jgi:hypothetical protein
VSTKLGTVVELLSGREFPTAQGLSAAQAPDRSFSCPRIASLTLYQRGDLLAQKRRHRQSSLGSEHPSLAQGLLVEGERDVSGVGHDEIV